jgi:hypothetical protein
MQSALPQGQQAASDMENDVDVSRFTQAAAASPAGVAGMAFQPDIAAGMNVNQYSTGDANSSMRPVLEFIQEAERARALLPAPLQLKLDQVLRQLGKQ